MSSYGTLVEANQYHALRLHTGPWDNAPPSERTAALNQATELIDQFNYLDQKHSVWLLCGANPDPTTEELREVELSQPLEFPRGDSPVVPKEIEWATYLIAQALLSGRDPDADLEALNVRSAAYMGVKTTHDRQMYMEHTSHLIPSPEAFTLIRSFFREETNFTTKRVS